MKFTPLYEQYNTLMHGIHPSTKRRIVNNGITYTKLLYDLIDKMEGVYNYYEELATESDSEEFIPSNFILV